MLTAEPVKRLGALSGSIGARHDNRGAVALTLMRPAAAAIVAVAVQGKGTDEFHLGELPVEPLYGNSHQGAAHLSGCGAVDRSPVRAGDQITEAAGEHNHGRSPAKAARFSPAALCSTWSPVRCALSAS